MTRTPQICLGTVQFGLPYGVTNEAGKVPEEEVSRILNFAATSGITLLDTAQAYGTAETVLGRCWPKHAPRCLISKLPAGAPRENWENSFRTSLNRLRTSKLDGFLLHNASDLLAQDGVALLNWLKSLRDRGLVDRIGVSIYDKSELQNLPLQALQLVQLPLSVYDQRLIRDGTIGRLLDLGIAVHVRSVFLQGLILQSIKNWPNHLTPAFRDHHTRWLEYLFQKRLSPLVGALSFIRACEGVEAILCGVLSRQELAQVLQAWNESKAHVLDSPNSWAWQCRLDIDPRSWPAR